MKDHDLRNSCRSFYSPGTSPFSGWPPKIPSLWQKLSNSDNYQKIPCLQELHIRLRQPWPLLKDKPISFIPQRDFLWIKISENHHK